MTVAHQLWFTAANSLEIRRQNLSAPAAGQVLVRSEYSAISAGTELLVYRGQIPDQMSLDSNLDSLQGKASYPMQYGYACVGVVMALGEGVDGSWLGRRVFSFQPHVSHFICCADQLIPVPDDISSDAAVFLANMETAVNLVQDGAPMIGERVVVLGQGVVGLLLSGILAAHPLKTLITLDTFESRRERSLQFGADVSLHPLADLSGVSSADLIYEVSGVPDALNLAVSLSGFDSRIVIGSWYGNKSATIALGGDAHRNRLKISTSQVSTLATALTGRWDKARRFDTAWDMIRLLQPQALISHQQPLSKAENLYQLLHETPDDVLQAVFTY